MFTVNRKRKVINALIRARREYDVAMVAFLQVFREDAMSLSIELGKLPDSELSEFLMAACELKVLTTLPCRSRSELSEFLMGGCESVLSKAMASLTSTDALGVIAAHDSLPESVKNAARNRIRAILDERKREAEAAEREAASSGRNHEEVEDYGRGRYCAGCGGC